jgi:hypothetical protein
MSLWEHLKKGLMEGIQTATDKTSEYTKIGRIKIDVLGVKKEIEEKLQELGGRLYHLIVEDQSYDIKKDKHIMQLIEQVKELEEELQVYSKELKRIKIDDGIDLD